MNLTIIAAVSENNVIGFENKVPWRIKEDMERFKQLTLNHPVIMGRKTFESIPEKFRPLPYRKNIVLSKTLDTINGVSIAKSIGHSLDLTEEQPSYIIGGGEIYKIFLPFTNKMELTKVHANYKGDAFFPNIEWNEWDLINEEKKTNPDGLNFSFLTYQRSF